MRRLRTLVLSGTELLGVAACGLTFTAWNAAARGSLDPGVALFFVGGAYLVVLAGKLCLRSPRAPWPDPDFPAFFLVGYFAVATALFLLALISPLGIAADGLLVMCAVVAWGLVRRTTPCPEPRLVATRAFPGLLNTMVSLLAATFWSADAIRPTVASRGTVIFKPWFDCFVHACTLRMLRDAHGMGTLENIVLPGRPAAVYHYAGYAIPALLAAVTGTPCYEAVTSFLIPAGVLLTGLAAYALARSWWGSAAGLAAAIALLLLPDASFYGIENPYLSYHWLQQVAPTGMYGVALAAVAWLLVFEGCRTGRWPTIGFGLVTAGLVVIYKAHIFIAIALPMWLAPALLVPGVKARWRSLWLVLACAVFVGVAWLARLVPGVPVLRLDGSGMSEYVDKLALNLPAGSLRERLAVRPSSSPLDVLGKGLVHLVFGVLGAWGLACAALAVPVWRGGGGPVAGGARAATRYRVAVALFPVVTILNYLVMTLGLAPDEHSITQADELIHRPLVWAYFVTAVWVGGAFYAVILKRWLERSGFARTVVCSLLCALVFVPYFLGQGVQVGPGWGKEVTNIALPAGFYQCTLYLREHSRRGAIVQDSARPADRALGALAERPEYVIEYPDPVKRALVMDRVRAVEHLEQIVGAAELQCYASSLGISWYVLRPNGRVRWDPAFVARPVFQSGGYRVYSFTERTR